MKTPLATGITLACLAVASGCRGAGTPFDASRATCSDRPNILFVFTDDHASHAIGAYGSRLNRTPNIDRLAAEGMLFRNCFVGNSICAPSRATILTGKHSHVNGVIDNGVAFDGAQTTFPKLLRTAGYQTAIVGKWHLKSDPTGFDHWQVLIGQGPYYNPPIKSAEGTTKITGYTTDILTDLALDWLQEGRDEERPFLLMLQHKAPHRNWQPGPDHLHTYDDVTIPEPATLFDDWSGRTTATGMQTMTVARHLTEGDLKLKPPGNLTAEQLATWNAAYEPKNEAFHAANLSGDELVRWKYQRYLKDYLRCIASVDDGLGRVLAYLDETGLAENTIVIYNSDQGFYLGDHGWYDKRWMYEESLRMPLIVRWPGTTSPGSTDTHLVQNIDFAETFLDVAGVTPPSDMQGRSLVPLLGGEAPDDWRRSLYYHYYEYPGAHMVNRHYGVRTDRYKLVRYYELDEWELFDLQQDPDELYSVHADPAMAGVVRELTEELERLQTRYGDTRPERPLSEIRGEIAAREAVRVERELALAWKNADDEVGQPGSPAGKPLTIGARCTPTYGNGVLAAHGGGSFGYALYLKSSIPTFAVRENGRLHEVGSGIPLAMGTSHHLAGVLDASGNIRIYVDGEPCGTKAASLLTRAPGEGLSVGVDAESAVGSYAPESPFAGELDDLRLYWGRLDEEEIRRWASAAD